MAEERSQVDQPASESDGAPKPAGDQACPPRPRIDQRSLTRALGLGAIGERENLSKVLDELRPYAPDDPVASQLVRRTVTTRGAFEVSDLSP